MSSTPTTDTATPVNTTPESKAPESKPAESTTPPLPSKTPLLLRAKVTTGKAIVTVFARVRTAQAAAVQKSLDLIAAADASLTKGLVVGEQFVLSRLRVSPEA